MGTDFVRKAAPSFRKSWDKARVALATDTLFTRTPDRVARSADFDIADHTELRRGDRVTVEKDGKDLVAKRGLREVARSTSPPAGLVKALETSCGVAGGTVEEVHELAGVAEISLC